MTLEFRKGNIFESGCAALVNPVNCVGVMGAGLALQFKRTYPCNYSDYKKACLMGNYVAGQIVSTYQEDGVLTINAATKTHWKDKSQLFNIGVLVDNFIQLCTDKELESIAIPPLGCGLGGLPWLSVKEILEEKIGAYLDKGGLTQFVVYEP